MIALHQAARLDQWGLPKAANRSARSPSLPVYRSRRGLTGLSGVADPASISAKIAVLVVAPVPRGKLEEQVRQRPGYGRMWAQQVKDFLQDLPAPGSMHEVVGQNSDGLRIAPKPARNRLAQNAIRLAS